MKTIRRNVSSPPLAGLQVAAEIICKEVTRQFPGADRPAVDRVSFRAASGSFNVLLGPSGSGKTTLLKMINRLVEPDSGQVYIGDVEVHDLPVTQLRRRIGYVIQQVGLFPHMTIAQNISVVPRLEGWDEAVIQEHVTALQNMVGLPESYLKRYPRQLSGGEQQRVGLARALAADPGILLMDEPFGALDAITRKNLQDQLLEIQRRVGKTIVFVTHDVEEAIKLGDQIVVMQAGRLVQAGSPLEIILHPRSPFVAELVGSDNLLRRMSVMSAEDLLARKNGQPAVNQGGASPALSTVRVKDNLRSVLSVMLRDGLEEVTVTGDDGRSVGSIQFNDLRAVLA